MRRGNAFGRICLYVCPVRPLTFESLDLEISFLYTGTSSELSRPSSYIKIVGS